MTLYSIRTICSCIQQCGSQCDQWRS